MYRISQFKIYIDELTIPNSSGRANNEEYKFLYRGISSLFGVRSSNIKELIIKRKSIDARKGKRAAYIYTFDVDIEGYDINLSKLNKVIRKRNMTVNLLTKPDKCFEPIIDGFISSGTNINSPVIVGAGPAGLFCGYVLALNGLKPIIIEQGSRIEERIKTVNSFWNNETKLNPYCNVSFGEGGAGTFSDGKLNTSVKDSFGRIEFVKNVFIQHGAPKEIGYLAKPHIGTDELRNVIINLRNSIISLGGTVLFDTCMTNVNIQDGKVNSIDVLNTIDDSKNNIQCDNLVLAIGHSARNTYCMLKDKVHMEQKDFAIGLRVEHPQDFIGLTQYGELYNMLPSADYKLRYHASNDRAVYSFCMCPGGHVVNASSEAEGSVTNGMSDHNRNSGFANSAIVVNVTQDDFEGDDVLAGMEFQKKWS